MLMKDDGLHMDTSEHGKTESIASRGYNVVLIYRPTWPSKRMQFHGLFRFDGCMVSTADTMTYFATLHCIMKARPGKTTAIDRKGKGSVAQELAENLVYDYEAIDRELPPALEGFLWEGK